MKRRVKEILKIEVSASGVTKKIGDILKSIHKEDIVGIFEKLLQDLLQRKTKKGE